MARKPRGKELKKAQEEEAALAARHQRLIEEAKRLSQEPPKKPDPHPQHLVYLQQQQLREQRAKYMKVETELRQRALEDPLQILPKKEPERPKTVYTIAQPGRCSECGLMTVVTRGGKDTCLGCN